MASTGTASMAAVAASPVAVTMTVLNSPRYTNSSLTNPFSGGRPQMATAPTRNINAVQGMALASPPSWSSCRVRAPWSTEPAQKNKRDLKRLWFHTCSRQPASPSTIHSGRRAERPSRASPRPMRMMPMFSTLW